MRSKGHEGSTPSAVTMDYEPITLEELRSLGVRIDSEMVCADSIEGLYFELNTKYGHEKWALLRAPVWCGDKLVVMIVKPRNDDDFDDDGNYIGVNDRWKDPGSECALCKRPKRKGELWWDTHTSSGIIYIQRKVEWRNGIRAGFRNLSRKGCGFKSRLDHYDTTR